GERRADRHVVGLGLGLELAHHPHDLAQGDALALAAQAVATARPALAVQDAGPHQMLQDLLEIPFGNALPLGDVAAAHRMLADVEGHVEHGFDSEHGLLAEPRHPRASSQAFFADPTVTPVDPNPPAPRAVRSSSLTSRHTARAWRATTHCAIRRPRVMRNGSLPRLIRITPTSPR